MRRAISFLAAAALLTLANTTLAQAVDNATKVSARAIAQEGLDRYDAGKYEEALDRFLRADALVHAPTMGLMAARSLEKLGRLLEASERYLATSRMPLAADASDAFREAVANAAKERDALLARIPSLVVTVAAPPGGEVTVTLDAAPIPPALLGQKRLADPGAHTVEARSGAQVKTTRVELKEGESLPVHLDLRPAETPSSTLRTAGWITAGVGGAGLILGAVTAGLAASKKAELDAAGCSANSCPAAVTDAVNSYNSLLPLSTAGFVAGAVALAGGVTMVLVAPSPAAPKTGARWSPVIGFGNVGLRGTF